MWNKPSAQALPEPSQAETQHCQKVIEHIVKIVNEQGGQISFAKFMQLALYAPGLGYYVSGAEKIGRAGDYVTAPMLSPLFSHCVAKQCQQVLNVLNGGDILEFGAGTGQMAAAILQYLAQQNCLPLHYYILEPSPDLCQRQQQHLQQVVPDLVGSVSWLQELPKHPFRGVMLANEVLDAMPVTRFCCKGNKVFEYFVTLKDRHFAWEQIETNNTALIDAINIVKKACPHLTSSVPYTSEINLYLPDWIASISHVLGQGMVLLIDYGFNQDEYYHPQRNQGTLMCHYRHRAHSDPFIYPGLQDITAHVDFTGVANVAKAQNLSVAGFIQQAKFLINCGILALAETSRQNEDPFTTIQQSQALKQLLMPHEMGELLKVMALTRNITIPLLGFSNNL